MILWIRLRWAALTFRVMRRLAAWCARGARLFMGRALRARYAQRYAAPQAAARLKACLACEHLVGADPIERCGKCHCLVRAKTQLPHARCPVGKW